MTHRKRPNAQRKWVKHLYRSHDEHGNEVHEPKSRLLRAGLSVLRKITDRVLPMAATEKFERVTQRLGNLREDLRKKLDAVSSMVRRSPHEPSARA